MEAPEIRQLPGFPDQAVLKKKEPRPALFNDVGYSGRRHVCDYSSGNLFSSTLETIPFAWIFRLGQGRTGTQLIALSELSGHGENVEANEGESESGPDQNSQVAVRFYEAAQSGVRPC
jgi:hypothetical protein